MPFPLWWTRLIPFGRRSEIDGGGTASARQVNHIEPAGFIGDVEGLTVRGDPDVLGDPADVKPPRRFQCGCIHFDDDAGPPAGHVDPAPGRMHGELRATEGNRRRTQRRALE